MVTISQQPAARSLDYTGDKHIPLATLIEFMHTSTLLHDDVVDESHMRRGRKTANDAWGNAPSVLVGDFLYARSFQMMVDVGSMRIMAILSGATCVIAEGEVLQLTNIGNPSISEEDYFETILGKTAMLFEAASHSGAVLAEATPEQERALQYYDLKIVNMRTFDNWISQLQQEVPHNLSSLPLSRCYI